MKIQTTELVITGIALFIMMLMLIIMPIDIVSFYGDKETYAKVYNLDMGKENWEWEYLKGWFYLGVLIVVGLTVISLRLIKSNDKVIEKVNWTFLVLLFGWIIIGFYNWMNSGFDH